jgi:hypothetical protein
VRTSFIANQPAQRQLDNPLPHRVDDVVVMRCHHHRRPGAIDPLQQIHDVLTRVRVEVAGGLVGQQDQRPVDKRAGDRDPLLLATR